RDDADAALAMDVAGHDADLALVGRDDAGAVRADEARLAALFAEAFGDLDHVEHRDALGDRDDELDARVDGFDDRFGGARRRDVDHRRVAAGLLARFGARAEPRSA